MVKFTFIIRLVFLFLTVTIPQLTRAATEKTDAEQGYAAYRIYPHKTISLRAEPSSNSPVTEQIQWKQGAGEFVRVMGKHDSEWALVHYDELKTLSYENNLYKKDTTISHVRYIKYSELEQNATTRYLIGNNKEFKARREPSEDSPATIPLTGGLYVTGRTDGDWVTVLVHSDKSLEVGPAFSDQYLDKCYVPGKEFREHCTLYLTYPDETDYTTCAKTAITPEWKSMQRSWHKKLGEPLNARQNFPLLVLILMILVIVVPIFTRGNEFVTMVLQYILLMIIFLMELSYILLFGYQFWFCEMFGRGFWGFLSGTFFTVVTLGVIYMQYLYFFGMIRAIKDFSRSFNTWIGTLLPGVITIGLLVYAIFSSFSIEENLKIIYLLLGTQLLQVIVVAIQLRRYPAYALMSALLLPLGTLSIILTTLMTFQFLVIVAIVMVAFKGLASSAYSSSSGSGGTEQGNGAPYAGVAENCPHFRASGFYCNHRSCGCTMVHKGRCDFGQM